MAFYPVAFEYSDEVFAFETDNLRLAVLKKSAYRKVLDYVVRNREFHKKFSQPHPDSYFTAASQKYYIDCEVRDYKYGKLIPLWISRKDQRDEIIGRVSFFNIAMGGMMLAQIGYHLDEKCQGQGIMTEAVKGACEIVFENLNLHRIEAFILPENQRSIDLIRRCGFVYEGTRYSYMNIDGKFRDHETFYLLRG